MLGFGRTSSSPLNTKHTGWAERFWFYTTISKKVEAGEKQEHSRRDETQTKVQRQTADGRMPSNHQIWRDNGKMFESCCISGCVSKCECRNVNRRGLVGSKQTKQDSLLLVLLLATGQLWQPALRFPSFCAFVYFHFLWSCWCCLFFMKSL